MTFGERLIELRKERGFTNRSDFADYIGMPSTTLRNYEKNDREPGHIFLKQMANIFHVSVDYLLCMTDDRTPPEKNPLFSNAEIEYIEKYRSLDDPGRSHVDTVLQWETDRMKQIEQTPAAIVELQNSSGEKGRLIDYYRSVSAGSGEVIFDDVYFERITLPDIPKYRRVAYAVKVDGRSMEPLYNDGDVLLIEPTCEVEVGEIGIFNVDGKAYVKKLGKEKLISLNKGYDDVKLTEDSSCMGRVVGKL